MYLMFLACYILHWDSSLAFASRSTVHVVYYLLELGEWVRGVRGVRGGEGG